MKKTVCFISIFDLTMVYHEMAKRLEEHGHHGVWMTTNPTWTAWLLTEGVAREDILELVFTEGDFLSAAEKQDVLRELVETEGAASRTANLSLIADRFVMGANRADINDYVCLYYRHIKRFLLEKQVDCVFGEPTNINELLTGLICEQLNILFLYPQTLRIPSGRFFFERAVATGEMVASGQAHALENSRQQAEEIVTQFRVKRSHPTYFYLNNRRFQGFGKNLQALLNRLKANPLAKKDNLTHHRFLDQLLLKITRFFNQVYLDHFFSYDELEQVDGKVAFYGLHVQPEASIDVYGPYASDQLKLIRDMRRSLPFDTTLVVKEHPNLIGLKPIRFFRELRRIPNVRVIHPQVSTFDIYKRANLVFTVNGTTAYEAALLGIPAVLFAPGFFMEFDSVHVCEDLTALKPLVFRLLSDSREDKHAIVSAMDRILRHSFRGYMTDPVSDPKVMDLQNLDELFVGFLDVTEHARSGGRVDVACP